MPRIDYALDARQRADARAALKLLAHSNLTLEDAARLALAGKHVLHRTKVAEACDRFHLSRVRKKNRRGKPLRSGTITWYEISLKPFVRDFGDEFIDSIDRSQFSKWLTALKIGDTSRAAIARACRALWRWGLAENPALVTADATIGVTFAATSGSAAERLVLTLDQTAAILHGAGWAQSAVALMLFACVRPEELNGEGKDPLRWEHVNFSERYIRIPDSISKTGKIRILEKLPPAVWAWLVPGEPHAPISPFGAKSVRVRAAQLAGFRDATGVSVKPWPHDCFRHTAATYFIAFTRDPGRVSEWLGHEGRPTLLHTTYRGQLTTARTQVTHEDAVRYFAQRPKKKAG